MREITRHLARPAPAIAALLALAACVAPGVEPEMPTAAQQQQAAVRDLSGQWVIQTLDGRELQQPVALTGTSASLVWEPACAGQTISYRAASEGIEFYRAEPEGDGWPIVCQIAYPQDLPRVLNALEGRWTASHASDGGILLSRSGARIALKPATAEAPATLAGEWRVAGIDGEDFDEPYGIALSADAEQIWWAPRCAGVQVAYQISGASFAVTPPPVPQPPAPGTRPPAPPPVCKIAPPPRLAEVMSAIRAADRIERTPANGIRLSGKGRSVTLFSQ